MIIRRYLTREVAKSAFMICLLLTLIIFCNRLVWFLTRLAGGGDKWQGIILQASLLWLPQFLTFLIPLGVGFALLSTLHRLQAHHEIEAIYAGGFQEKAWIKRLVGIGFITAILVALFSWWLAPAALSYQKTLTAQNQSFLTEILFTPGQFQTIPGGSGVIYVTTPDEKTGFSKDLFIANPTRSTPVGEIDLILAKKATQALSPFQNDLITLSLFQGRRYQGTPGALHFSITQFDKFILNPKPLEVEKLGPKKNEQPTLTLFGKADDASRGELAWRFSLPIMAFVLPLLTFPLYRPCLKQERLGILFLCIFVLLLYPNCLLLGRPWFEQTHHLPFLGMGVVHLFFLALASFFIFGPHRKLVSRLRLRL